MECREIDMWVSVLHDGESVSPEAARHIQDCVECRQKLRTYSDIGSELRLLASRTAAQGTVPRISLKAPRRRGVWSPLRFLIGSTLVPRFALLLLAGACVTASISLAVLHAQAPAKPLWFQFQLEESQPSGVEAQATPQQDVAQTGYDQVSGVWANKSVIEKHVAVFKIEESRVELGIRARRIHPAEARKQHEIRQLLGDLEHHRYTYVPGQNLAVPIEGGGTLELSGKIADHQPELAFGFPLKPQINELVLASPVLTTAKALTVHTVGGNARTSEGATNDGVVLYAPGTGLFTFGLRPFAGAVEGKADWGKLEFTIEGQHYFLWSAVPITGGGQPRTVWVKEDPVFSPINGKVANWFIGTWKLDEPYPNN